MKIKTGKRYELFAEIDGKKDNKRFVLLTTNLPPDWVYENIEVPEKKKRVTVRVLSKEFYKNFANKKTAAYKVLFLEREWFAFEWQFLKEI